MMKMMDAFSDKFSNKRASAASVALSLTACIVWLATLEYRDGIESRVAMGDASVSSSRILADIMDESAPTPNLFPLLTKDYIGFACTVIGLILAAGAGIGGGGLLVPIFILIFDFSVKHAIPLASVTVFGGALANNLLNARKSHPDHPSRPAIDWDLIVQLEPMTIAGALIGADLNDLLPDVVLVVMLFLLLSITAYKTLQKAHKLHQKETEDRMVGQHEAEALLANAKSYVEDDAANVSTDNSPSSSYGSVNAEYDKLNNRSFSEAQVHQAWKSAVQLTVLFVVITILNLLKGGAGESGGGPIGLAYCGPACFWVTEGAMLVVILFFAIFTRRNVLERARTDGPLLSEIDWDDDNTIIYPIYAIVAGLVAGLFGVGGGIVKGPLMLALGVHPAVASATSACMILFTSSTSTVSYAIFGLLMYDYALGCIAVGFVSTLVGQTLMHILMEKYQRNSYIAYTIGIVVGLSAIAMTIESVLTIFF